MVNIYMYKHWTFEEMEILKKFYPEKGAKYCAAILNITKNKVIYKANSLNIKFNKNNISTIRKKSYKVKTEMFESCILPETAYLLGFIWGDGHIVNINTKGKTEHRIIVNGLESDINNILEIFKLHGEWTTKTIIPKSTKDGFNRKPFIRITTSNRPLVEFLIKHDFHLKSGISADKIMNHIPEHLHRFFLLGLIDADGCFHKGKNTKKNKGGWTRRCIIASTFNQDWTFIRTIYNKIEVCSHIQLNNTKQGKSSKLVVSGKNNIQKIINFLWPNGFEFGFHRKFIKASFTASS